MLGNLLRHWPNINLALVQRSGQWIFIIYLALLLLTQILILWDVNLIIVLPQVLSTTRLVLITSCIGQNLSTIHSAVANYLRLPTHFRLNIIISVKRVGGRTIKCIWHCFLVDKDSDRYLSPIQALAFGSACIWRSEPLSTKKQCHMHILNIITQMTAQVGLIVM